VVAELSLKVDQGIPPLEPVPPLMVRREDRLDEEFTQLVTWSSFHAWLPVGLEDQGLINHRARVAKT
jgi:hypothetical protein